MDFTFFSIFLFLCINVLYFFYKPKPDAEVLFSDDKDKITGSVFSGYFILLFYFLAVLGTQFGINVTTLYVNCQNSVSNFSSAALITFIPWVLVFGAMIAVLILFPGFKSAFSNVIGYYVVSTSANDLFKEMLVNTTVDNIGKENADMDPKEVDKLKATAESIIKICGNMSVLINQMVPENFVEYWNLIQPLMKKDVTELDKKRQQLLDLVAMRDKIGEILWLFYTGVLIIFYTQFKLTVQPCEKSPEDLAKEQQDYLDQQHQANLEAEKLKNTTYEVS
jgi:hypothetical protein